MRIRHEVLILLHYTVHHMRKIFIYAFRLDQPYSLVVHENIGHLQ